MKIIAISGPPRSGKDTLATHLRGHRMKLSDPLKRGVRTIFHVDELIEADIEKAKDTQFEFLGGLSYRQQQINLYHYLVRQHGPTVLGDILVRRLLPLEHMIESMHNGILILSDSGRNEDMIPLVNRYGSESIVVVRLVRDGCTYKGDSRSELDPLAFSTVVVENDGTIKEMVDQAVAGIVTYRPQWPSLETLV